MPADRRIPPRSAGLLVIGDEILSGRTREANAALLAARLCQHGIPLLECRIVPDRQDAIVGALNALRGSYDIVFTSGGIGPTHDDITTAAVARAFSVPLIRSRQAEQALCEYSRIAGRPVNAARLKMADVPEGSSLIECSATAAPGFRIENVFVLAGVPSIFASMLDTVLAGLPAAPAIASCSLRVAVGESEIAELLAGLQQQFSNLIIGSYPRIVDGKHCVDLVVRAAAAAAAEEALAALAQRLTDAGIKWHQ